MNSHDAGGTYPVTPIELPIDMPIPEGCLCKWDYDEKRKVKRVKFLAMGCLARDHVKAWNKAHQLDLEIDGQVEAVRRYRGERGKDKKPRKRPEEKALIPEYFRTRMS